jgi:hypothetical protein
MYLRPLAIWAIEHALHQSRAFATDQAPTSQGAEPALPPR